MKLLVLLLGVAQLSSALRIQAQDDKPLKYRYYLLNLYNRPQRLKKFWELLQPSMRDHICRVEATDATKMNKTDFMEGGRFAGRLSKHAMDMLHVNKRGDWKDLNDGSIACFLSHSQAWEQMIADDVDVGIIVEDDNNKWSQNYEQDLKRLILNKDTMYNFDVILMSHCGEGMGNNAQLRKGGSACTGAMAVSKAGAKKMLDKLLPIDTSVDYQLNLVFANQPDVNFYRTVPKMGDQMWFGSDVQTDAYWPGGDNWHPDATIWPEGTKHLNRESADPWKLIPDCTDTAAVKEQNKNCPGGCGYVAEEEAAESL